eukprot:6834288-Pyramimonas_sp.AAC.1
MIFASWGPPGTPLGIFLGRLRGLFGRVEAILGVSGHSWAFLEASSALLGAFWTHVWLAALSEDARDPWKCPAVPRL